MTAQNQSFIPAAPKAPPTPPGLPLLGNLMPFLKAQGAIPVKAFQEYSRQHGDVVCVRAGSQRIYVVAHPDLLHEILVRRLHDFHKPIVARNPPDGLARFLGSGLVTADHEPWRPQRKLIQPLMHAKHIESYANTMTRMAQRLMSQWQDSSVREIDTDMLQVTMWIIAETMFGTDPANTEKLEQAARQMQAITVADTLLPLPGWLARRRAERARQINKIFTDIVSGFIRTRSSSEVEEQDDLLTLLLRARDEDNQPMPESWVRDNILTLFMAGHETTAYTLTWALYYLDQHPIIAEKLRQEVDSVLAGRLPTMAYVAHLQYTEMVIKESLRIEPVVSAFTRYILEDVELGGYQLKGRSVIFIPIYGLHHDPRWWQHPERFDPERFAPANESNLPHYAYLPFGGGPRVCIGNHFAMLEAKILLASFVSHYNLTVIPRQHITPHRLITTTPKHGLRMRVERRRFQ